MKKGLRLPYTNWSKVGAAFLMSPRQGETAYLEDYFDLSQLITASTCNIPKYTITVL